jgi:hypothetical protein
LSPARLSLVALALSLIASAGTPTDAAAQLGKLKKALGKKTETADAGGGCVPTGKATEVQTFTLTAAQMAKINAGLDAELEAAPAATREYDTRVAASEKENAAYEKANEQYNKDSEKYEACAGKVRDSDQAKSEELHGKSDASGAAVRGEMSEEEITALAERAQAAMQRVSAGQGTAEDHKTIEQFQQMATGFQTRSMDATAAAQESHTFDQEQEARVEKACGKGPVAPTAPTSAEPPAETIRSAGAKAAGMSPNDYALGRETLIAAAYSNLVVKPGKLSGEEADAMNQAIQETAGKLCDLRKAGVPL